MVEESFTPGSDRVRDLSPIQAYSWDLKQRLSIWVLQITTMYNGDLGLASTSFFLSFSLFLTCGLDLLCLP